ncbi:MAG: PEP/pyruvate-binding domain-containing protein [Candidatus Nanohaloarchaea archaeon]
MVEWKGEIDESRSGEKAALLDSLQDLQVPNFFVITREEAGRIVEGAETPEEIVNSEIPGDVRQEIEDAYREVGMSSEVRESSDRAKELVGGQRDTQRVSIRVSGGEKGLYDYKLNVGSSSLENAVKQVIASFYRRGHDEPPAVIVQKMVEPDQTGAVVPGYLGSFGLVESVNGLGISLEEGITAPELYLVEDRSMVERKVPGEQVKVTRHPMNGGHQRKTVRREGPSFSDSDIQDILQKAESHDLGLKFVHKRGTFYVVDAFETDSFNPFSSPAASLQGVRASPGEIDGVVGEDVTLTDETLPPDRYDNAIIARKGGYTSADAQRARAKDKPALFAFDGDVSAGDRVSIAPDEVEATAEQKDRRNKQVSPAEGVTALEVLPLNAQGRAVNLSPPFSTGYAVTDRPVRAERIPPGNHLESYADVFRFDGDRFVLDGRRLDPEALPGALEYLEGGLQVLVIDYPHRETVRKAVEEGFDVLAVSRGVEDAQKVVEREERRFIMEKLREL